MRGNNLSSRTHTGVGPFVVPCSGHRFASPADAAEHSQRRVSNADSMIRQHGSKGRQSWAASGQIPIGLPHCGNDRGFAACLHLRAMPLYGIHGSLDSPFAWQGETDVTSNVRASALPVGARPPRCTNIARFHHAAGGVSWTPGHTRNPEELVVEIDDRPDWTPSRRAEQAALIWTSAALEVGIRLGHMHSADPPRKEYVSAVTLVDGCWYDIGVRESLINPGKLRIRAAERADECTSACCDSAQPWPRRARAA